MNMGEKREISECKIWCEEQVMEGSLFIAEYLDRMERTWGKWSGSDQRKLAIFLLGRQGDWLHVFLT